MDGAWQRKAGGCPNSNVPGRRPNSAANGRPGSDNGRRRSRIVAAALRVTAAGAAAALFFGLPIDRQALGRTLAFAAAALRQPEQAARLLCERADHAAAPAGGGTVSDSGEGGSGALSPEEEPKDVPAAVPSAAESPADERAAPPAEDGSGGKVIAQKVSGGTVVDGITVKNRSSAMPDIREALSTPLTQRFADTDEVQVLIVHTHTTERYLTYDTGYYNAADRERTTDGSVNVCAVGRAVVQALAEAGIRAVQDTTVHDQPKYTGAYTRSAETVSANMKKYPHLRVVLDLHRDAIMQGDTGLVKPTVTADGRAAAQMMIVVGTVSTTALPHPNKAQNLALAAQWQRLLCSDYPGLMRPLSTVGSRYNQHLSPGYLLVEVGSEGNTVDEAAYSGTLLGKTLAKLLK